MFLVSDTTDFNCYFYFKQTNIRKKTLAISRTKAGFFRPGSSDFSSIQTLLGDFINDRTSPSLLEKIHEEKANRLINNTWDNGEPFERVIGSDEDLKEIRYRKCYDNES